MTTIEQLLSRWVNVNLAVHSARTISVRENTDSSRKGLHMGTITEFFFSGTAADLAMAGAIVIAGWVAWVYRYNR
jgi:hypothetical protein